MRLIYGSVFMFALSACAHAQQYEVGFLAGAGVLSKSTITAPAGTATTGLKPGMAFGALISHNLYSHLSGEIRYMYRDNPLKLSSGGNETSFSAMSHAVHYDIVLHPNSKDSGFEPFVAVGGGMRIYKGTGTEVAFQPLSEFAYLTKTQELKPLLTMGGGLKMRLKHSVYLRAEFRDYMTPFPKNVIAPAAGAKVSTFLHDFVPMVGISFGF